MLNTPETTIKITDEQAQAIEETKSRLLNLESEISVATKTLRALKLEIERSTKEKSYQEELLSQTTTKVEEIQNTISQLETTLAEKNSELESITVKINNKKIENDAKEVELSEKEAKLEQEKEELNKKVEDFNIKSSQLLEDQLSINTAKDAFIKATETVKWR